MSLSDIEWTDYTWNPIAAFHKKTEKRGWFCQRVSQECLRCYAASMNRFRGNGLDYVAGNAAHVRIELLTKTLYELYRLRKPKKIFPCSMTDLFFELHPFEMIDQVFQVMVDVQMRGHIFQVLTKRIERFLEWTFSNRQRRGWVEDNPRIWCGVTAGDPKVADHRIVQLQRLPAAVRFISMEPLLGDINILPHLLAGKRHHRPLIHCVIVGGEADRRSRPMHPRWVTAIEHYCAQAGVPFFFKQWGDYIPADQASPAIRRRFLQGARARHIFRFNDGTEVYRVGKKTAGRRLNNREWNEMPKVAA